MTMSRLLMLTGESKVADSRNHPSSSSVLLLATQQLLLCVLLLALSSWSPSFVQALSVANTRRRSRLSKFSLGSTATTSDTATTATTTTPTMSSSSDSCASDQPELPLLPLLQNVFSPAVHSYDIEKTIVQANAKGFVLRLESTNDDTTITIPNQVFIKQVLAHDYVLTKKDWPDLRRTLCYARTEARFYKDFLPLLHETLQHSFPLVHYAADHLSPWIPPDELANAAATTNTKSDKIAEFLQVKASQSAEENEAQVAALLQNDNNNPHTMIPPGAVLVLQAISPTEYYQTSPISVGECRRCLDAVATLHAAAWQQGPLLQRAATALSRASFHLSVRNPRELATAVTTWEEHFLPTFREYLQQANLWDQPSIQQLGQRIVQVAHYVSDQVTPETAAAPYATLIHGDFKAMNVFLPKEANDDIANDNGTTDNDDKPVILVDFASVGVGLGVSDVAMHVHHAVRPEDLAHGGEEELVRHYWTTLTQLLKQQSNNAAEMDYPWEVCQRHYRLAVVDYFRFFMARFWKTATPETMAKKKDSCNTNYINRDPLAAMAYIERVDRYLAEIEVEFEKQQQPVA